MTTAPALDLADSAAALRRLNGRHHHALADLLDAVEAGRAELREIIRPGQRSTTTRERLAVRDQLVVEAAARFFPDHSPTSAAQALCRRMGRFDSVVWSRWHGERVPAECPERYRGDVEGVAWEILKAGGAIPSARTIRRILATNRPVFVASTMPDLEGPSTEEHTP